MIKSKFQLEKEKERSILDCITSITGKLNEATVVGFSAPMGGIAGTQPSWAQQQANKLTNLSLPPPLKPGQSTPFIARPPFVGQGQSSQQPQRSNQAQIARPSPDIVEPSADERYNQTMARGNFSGASISDEATMRERASGQVRSAAATPTAPYDPLAWLNNPEESKRWRDQNPEVKQPEIPADTKEEADRKAQRKSEDDAIAARNRREAEIQAKKEAREAAETQAESVRKEIATSGNLKRDARNTRETTRLKQEETAQENREKERDINRRRYSRPIYNKDGTVTDSHTGRTIGNLGKNEGDGSGGSSIPESFKGSLNRLDEIASGIAAGITAIAGTELGKHIKKFAINAGSEAINFAKTQAPKIGYIALTPPRVLAAAATGRLSGLGYSKEGAIDTFNYYRNMIGGLGKAGGTLLTGLAGTAAGQKVGTAAGTAAGKVASWVGPLGIKLGKDVVGALDPAGHVDAFADEAALNTGAALWDPRMLSYNIKSKPLAQEKN